MNKRNNLLSNLKFDLPASFVVFFVALPLCLGIALASGAPLFSGIIAGVIGGIVIGSISGSSIGVSGPAAGLTAIVLAAIATLGTYEDFLLAVVLSGAIQIIFGLLKAGIIGYYFPTSVIKGMLTGIGIIIILKQIPHFFGYDVDPEGDWEFIQFDGENTFTEILVSLNHITLGSTIIAFISLSVMLFWDKILSKKHQFFKVIQGAFVAVILGIFYQILFGHHEIIGINSTHLVNVPVPNSINEFFDVFSFPNFSSLGNSQIWIIAFTIALVGSLETLLSVEATDRIDPLKRVTPTNRELFAQGTGNILSGLIGGLPITQVIVRSSANAQSGGRTKMSAIIHGFLLLFAVILIPSTLNLIPLSVLASILLVVGYKLATPVLFKKMYKLGKKQFIPFIITVLVIVFKDLLWGISIGLAFSVMQVLFNSYKNSFFINKNELDSNKLLNISLAEEVSFLNKGAILRELEAIPEGSNLNIDIRNNRFIDHDIIELFDDFITKSKDNNIKINIVTKNEDIIEPTNFNSYFFGEVKETKARKKINLLNLTPDEALEFLKEGNHRFQNNLKANRNLLNQVNETSEGQFPFAAILSCIDSRVSAELVFDQGLGDIFSIRIAGNFVNPDILGSMEFSCKVAGSKLIVVMGHTNCGAIKGACDNVELGNLTGLISKIKPAVNNIIIPKEFELRNSSNIEFVNNVAKENIKLTMERIRNESAILKEMEEKGEIKIVGCLYNIENGVADFDC